MRPKRDTHKRGGINNILHRLTNFEPLALVSCRAVDVAHRRWENLKTLIRKRKRLVGAREHKVHDPRLRHFRLAVEDILVVGNLLIRNGDWKLCGKKRN